MRWQKIGAFVFYLFLYVFSSAKPVLALEKFSVNLDQIASHDWRLIGVRLSISELLQNPQQFSLAVKQLKLPEPFADFQFLDIQCQHFSWHNQNIQCQSGRASLKSKLISAEEFDFSFFISQQKSQFRLQNLKLAKGRLSLSAYEQNGKWLVKAKLHNLSLNQLYPYFARDKHLIDEISGGRLSTDLIIKGDKNGFSSFQSSHQIKGLSLQAKRGQWVTEQAGITGWLKAELKKQQWHWKNSVNIHRGEYYFDPVYLDINNNNIEINAQGVVLENGKTRVNQGQYSHQGIITLDFSGLLSHQAEFVFDQAIISAKIAELNAFSELYLAPFAQQTAFEGIHLQGNLDFTVQLLNSQLILVDTQLEELSLKDDMQRFSIDNARGKVNWFRDREQAIPSQLSWDSLKLRAIPIEAGRLDFLFINKQLSLLQKSEISLLDGILKINRFEWLKTKADQPEVYFEGGISDLSLEKLSKAFDWTVLSGSISGNIPGVSYQNKTLKLDGELKAQLFDGEIRINKLSSSGLLTDFSKFSLEMEVDNLDLHQITQKFQMGGIEGRVSGFIKNLYLENWQPVTFYAWLGTPDNDDSRHRISQKAVENIASIGGGGAADVISKGFLRFFDTFSYDRLGFGCYLYQGVCQLMGVEASEQGYYIVKGGGIPRIDIIGYNPRVDWEVLMTRLSRIASTDKIVIE